MAAFFIRLGLIDQRIIQKVVKAFFHIQILILPSFPAYEHLFQNHQNLADSSVVCIREIASFTEAFTEGRGVGSV